MTLVKFSLIMIAFQLLSICATFANDTTKSKYGVYGGINPNFHSAQFTNLPGIPNCCPRFESGSGLGYNFGVLYEHRLGKEFSLGVRLGLHSLSGTLSAEEETTVITPTGPLNGMFEHTVESGFMNVGLEPALIYSPTPRFNISLGMRVGQNLTYTFNQVETIIQPEGVGTFMDEDGNDTRKRTRNEFEGDLPDANTFQMALFSGLSYEMPLNTDNTMRIVPELFYYFGLSDMVKETDWTVNSLRLSVAIKYVPLPKTVKPEVFKKEFKIDSVRIESDLITAVTYKRGIENIENHRSETDIEIIHTEIISRVDTILIPKTYALSGAIEAVGVDNAGNEIPNPLFRIEEFISNRLDPLLNYVFFEDNSHTLPARYKSISKDAARQFDLTDLFRDSTLQIYHNILNIVGERLNMYPAANVVLIGCNSDMGAESKNLELSRNRAETVRDYLVNVWNINPQRFKIEAKNLPDKASTPKTEADKIAENRRVEIYSNDFRILEPIFIEKIDRSSNPPIVRFKLKGQSDAGLKSWELKAYQSSDDESIFTKSGDRNLVESIDWELAQFQKLIPKSPEPLIYSLNLVDNHGNVKSIDNKTKEIEVMTVQHKRTEQIGDYEIEQFSLILFDFDKHVIADNDKTIIEFIRSRLKKESELEILGYTDRTGIADHNKKLSERRAEATRTALQRPDAKVVGFGGDKLLYNNELPEGRFYCRTVNIIVKTKVK
ncbi:MAG: OmpA family protein [Candidatus Kapabacteria bacterium]|nr:OmpA family protein [Candidatus Kapabacteria bacterium]